MTALTIGRELSPIAALQSQLAQRAESYRQALPSHIKPETLQRTVVMAATQNPTLLNANRQSLMLACMKAAQDGLLPDGREAALVPFSSRKKDDQGRWHSVWEVVYMPMVYGLRKKILQSGEIATMNVGVVYRAELQAGRFIFDVGMDPPIRYKPDLELPAEEIADDKIIAGWSLVKFKDGSYSAEVMRRAEIDAIRELSQTGATKDRQGKPRDSKGQWAEHFAEMAKKTVMRRHSKVLPMSGDIFRDIEAEEQDRYAASAAQMLDAVDEAPPVALTDMAKDAPAHDDDGVLIERDVQIDPATGMTEVDEDTARELDAQQTYQDLDGPFIEDEAAEPEEMNEAQRTIIADLERRLGRAEILADVRSVMAEWDKHKVTFPDSAAVKMDEAIRRKAMKVGERAPTAQ